jgi:asparagine synthase (glutamine-hydrolysing)
VSGIGGVARMDACAAGPPARARMLAALAARGPDGAYERTLGGATLLFTALDTTMRGLGEIQPFSADSRVWVVADARIDARADLLRHLRTAGRRVDDGAGDAELIWHAHAEWGERCVDRLLGDFAFAVWDDTARTLFCARDHFGVKPLFHAQAAGSFVFSNTLDCVRAHPAVGSDLDEEVIADFLLFDANLGAERTAYAQIRRLPAGHCLRWDARGLHVWRYWTFAIPERVQYRRRSEYVEHFSALLQTAVADRVRADAVSVELSGGVDSTAVALAAARAMASRNPPMLHTYVVDRAARSDDVRFAAMVADHLGLPLRRFAVDAREDHRPVRGPEPSLDPVAPVQAGPAYEALARNSRVVLTGWDGDALAGEAPSPYWRSLLRHGDIGRVAREVLVYAWKQRRFWPKAWETRSRGRAVGPEPFPRWITPAFEQRWQLRERWRAFNEAPLPTHAVRPEAARLYQLIADSPDFFGRLDAAATHRPLEFRHPLMDLRVVGFCMSLPPFPWCVDKAILRAALRDDAPSTVLRRPKTPARPGDADWLQRQAQCWAGSLRPARALRAFVDAKALADVPEPRLTMWQDLRAHGLNCWLSGVEADTSAPDLRHEQRPPASHEPAADEEAVSRASSAGVRLDSPAHAVSRDER